MKILFRLITVLYPTVGKQQESFLMESRVNRPEDFRVRYGEKSRSTQTFIADSKRDNTHSIMCPFSGWQTWNSIREIFWKLIPKPFSLFFREKIVRKYVIHEPLLLPCYIFQWIRTLGEVGVLLDFLRKEHHMIVTLIFRLVHESRLNCEWKINENENVWIL